jgi:hypothetical protein
MGNCLNTTAVQEQNTCSVCYEICHVRTPCNHLLCELCSEQLTHKICPICRLPFESEDPLSRVQHITLDDLVEQLNGGYPYQLVQQNNTTKLEEWLIQNPSQINDDKMLGLTLLHDACMYAKTDCVKLLLKYGANVNAANCMGLTPLHFACGNQNIDIVVALLEAGANKNATTQANRTPLDHSKLWNTDHLLVEYLS